ncbi:MAG TPA: tetratricopeptide repeat protein [Pyrinomonadaceae bacterium]|nr:tetratricopeptide repeat protein [Pyrinomonadaceae bacterium]
MVRNFRLLIFAVLLVCFAFSLNSTPCVAQTSKADALPSGSEVWQLLQAGLDLYRQGEFEAALVNAKKAAALEPQNYRPHLLAGLANDGLLRSKSASQEYALAILLAPQEKELYLFKAKADVARGATEEALAACRKALEIDPNYAEAYAEMGETLIGIDKRKAEAIAAFQTAIKLNPGYLGSYESLAQIFASAKDEKTAEKVYRQCIAADPRRMCGRFALGRMLLEQGRLAEARELWEGRTSDDERGRPMFIEVLKRAENVKLASQQLAAHPDDPERLVAMGFAVLEGDSWVVDGRQEKALTYFTKALKLKPDHARAQYGIIKAHIEAGDTTKKEKKELDLELARLRKLDPALADELTEYRKSYTGGLIGIPVDRNQ